jgi:hypothetical protein
VPMLQFPCLAQFEQLPFDVSNVLPVGMAAYAYGDTMLNTRTILKREGIKKISVYQRPLVDKTSFTSKTEYINEQGNIYQTSVCYANTKSKNSEFCLKDTFLYDVRHRPVEVISMDGIGSSYMRILTEYLNNGEVKNSFILISGDSSSSYNFYNKRSQLIKYKSFMKGKLLIAADLYYNEDGFPDSIQNHDTYWRTFIFKRTNRKKTMEIEMQNPLSRYTWIYNNRTGQCITTRIEMGRQFSKPAQPDKKYGKEVEIDYYYNPDGTLSKMVNKTTGKPKMTMIYTYSK